MLAAVIVGPKSSSFGYSIGFDNAMRPEMITKIIRKRFRVADVRVIGQLIPTEFLCVIGAHRRHLMEAHELHKKVPARTPCVLRVSPPGTNGNGPKAENGKKLADK